MNLQDYAELTKGQQCFCCHAEFKLPVIRHRDHPDGLLIEGFEKRQWLSIVCSCGYENSLKYLGKVRSSGDIRISISDVQRARLALSRAAPGDAQFVRTVEEVVNELLREKLERKHKIIARLLMGDVLSQEDNEWLEERYGLTDVDKIYENISSGRKLVYPPKISSNDRMMFRRLVLLGIILEEENPTRFAERALAT